jgi:sec-independent protein translocase protein TatA
MLPGMFGFGLSELLVILGIVVIVFGATRLPQIGKGLGEGIRNFRIAHREPPQIEATPDPARPHDASRGETR